MVGVLDPQPRSNNYEVPHPRNVGCLYSIIGNLPIAVGEFLDGVGEVDSEDVLGVVHDIGTGVFRYGRVQSCLVEQVLDSADGASSDCHSHDVF